MVLPAHDEAANLPSVLADAQHHLPSVAERWEIVVVDDGSTDLTPDLLADWSARSPQVRTVRHPSCRGYGAAVRSGIAAARHRHVFLTDADGQFGFGPLAEFAQPVARGEADLAIGWRSPRADTWWRRQLGGLWTALAAQALGLRVRDANCAYKLLPTSVATALALESGSGAISVELLARLARAGARITQSPVPHAPRLHGVASGGSPSVALRSIGELTRLVSRLHGADPAAVRVALALARQHEPGAERLQYE